MKKITCFDELCKVSEVVRVNIAIAKDYMLEQYNIDRLELILDTKVSIHAVLNVYSWELNIISSDDYLKISKELDNYFRSLISEWSGVKSIL